MASIQQVDGGRLEPSLRVFVVVLRTGGHLVAKERSPVLAPVIVLKTAVACVEAGGAATASTAATAAAAAAKAEAAAAAAEASASGWAAKASASGWDSRAVAVAVAVAAGWSAAGWPFRTAVAFLRVVLDPRVSGSCLGAQQ